MPLCAVCRRALLCARRPRPIGASVRYRPHQLRRLSTGSSAAQRRDKVEGDDADDFSDILPATTWSTRAYFAPAPSVAGVATDEVDDAKLDHLLKLSALPAPATADERQALVADLNAQMRFVRRVQTIDTAGVKPMTNVVFDTADTASGPIDLSDAIDQLERRDARIAATGAQTSAPSEAQTAADQPPAAAVLPAADFDYRSLAAKTKNGFYVVSGGLR